MVGTTINNDIGQIITALGGNPDGLTDNLLSTKLNKIIELLHGGSGGGGSSYSTDEIVIGAYMGKPLYRKVFEITNARLLAKWDSFNMTSYVSDLNIEQYVDAKIINIDYKMVVNCGGIVVDGIHYLMLPFELASTEHNKLIIIEYTKTTD